MVAICWTLQSLNAAISHALQMLHLKWENSRTGYQAQQLELAVQQKAKLKINVAFL